MFKNISNLPYTYDIIKCYFPNRDDVGEKPYDVIPYSSYHYCLVLGEFPEKHEVMVVYGTSLKDKKIYKNDFVFNEEMIKIVNLNHETKYIFKPDSIAILPYNTRFFIPGIVGSCDENISSKLDKFLSIYEIEDLMGDLKRSNYRILPKSWWDFPKYKIQ